MKNFLIEKKDTALLAIDIQERLFNVMDENVRTLMVKNISILIDTCSVFSIPIILTEQYRKGLGPTITPLKEKTEHITALEKTTFNCMNDKNIPGAVEASNKNTFILCGIESHICVFQTALSLLNMGYKVVIAADAVMSRRKADWKLAMKALSQAGALVYPTETISFMLMEDSALPEFKKLAPLFK